MSKLVFYSNKNSHGRRDATGAFIPEAKKFAKFHGIPDENVIGIDGTKSNPAARRRAQVLNALRDVEQLELLAFFAHGWPNGIQFGFQRKHIQLLVGHFPAKPYLKVVLYACLNAENDKRDRDHRNVGPGTDGGFADLMRDEMVRFGMTEGRVDAHKTAGHTSWNPYVVRFPCEDVQDEEFGAEGGGWIVEPGSTYWKKWVKALRVNVNDIRYNFPMMDEADILNELRGIW
jgi:hypothetical protein